MPGPCNAKKKRKSLAKKEKMKSSERQQAQSLSSPSFTSHSFAASTTRLNSTINGDQTLPQTPYIHDPGNGPRVKDTRAFLNSFFAQPASLDDPLCAEFAKEEVIQMLCTVLPEEIALILWYNKSRLNGRICPACQRLYRLGDTLQDHLSDQLRRTSRDSHPQLQREQQISGLCSPVCFILASFDYPTAIKSSWGLMADEMNDVTWDLLSNPGNGQGDKGLGLLLKMTRLDDLGLGQLCFPEWTPTM